MIPIPQEVEFWRKKTRFAWYTANHTMNSNSLKSNCFLSAKVEVSQLMYHIKKVLLFSFSWWVQRLLLSIFICSLLRSILGNHLYSVLRILYSVFCVSYCQSLADVQYPCLSVTVNWQNHRKCRYYQKPPHRQHWSRWDLSLFILLNYEFHSNSWRKSVCLLSSIQ